MFQSAVVAYLFFLPLGQFVVFPIAGAMATGTDVALALLLAAAGIEAVSGGGGEGGTAASGAMNARLGRLPGGALLAGFGVWVAFSAVWSPHPDYALAKGLGIAALAAGALAIGVGGIRAGRAADAWLAGTASTLFLIWAVWLFGSDPLRDRILYAGGGIRGLPFDRVRGPFLHPNMLGDYLVVSAALLWARWPAWRAVGRWVPGLFAALLALTLALTGPGVWAGAGVLVIAWAATMEGGRKLAVEAAGIVVLALVAALAVAPAALSFGGVELVTAAIRPEIWAGAVRAWFHAPVWGVGAAPFLAYAGDPELYGGGAYPWDAHSLYLSVLGQFGVVGFALVVGGGVRVGVGVLGRSGSRMRSAVLAALVAVAAHGLLVASEDFRHLWALVGVALLVVVGEGREAGEGWTGESA